MASATIDPVERPADRQADLLARGIIAPLAVMALAYGLWWVSDRLVYVGPIDRATFGWLVVVPVWFSAPAVAGVTWRPLTSGNTTAAMIAVGVTASVVAATLYWLAIASPDCASGPVHAPVEWLGPSAFVGVSVGVGLVVSGLMATTLIRGGHRWWAIVAGAVTDLAFVSVAFLGAAITLLGPMCQRPSI
jgi:hypothetical protein